MTDACDQLIAELADWRPLGKTGSDALRQRIVLRIHGVGQERQAFWINLGEYRFQKYAYRMLPEVS